MRRSEGHTTPVASSEPRYRVSSESWGCRPVPWRGDVDSRIEQELEWQRCMEGEEMPLQQSSLGQGEVVDVSLGFFDRRQFEHDDYATNIGPCIIFADDPCLPEPPYIRNFVAKIGPQIFQRDTRLEVVISNDLHQANSIGCATKSSCTPAAVQRTAW